MAHVEGYTATPAAIEANRIAGEAARKRLLTGLPIAERRLELAGISTVLLEGGAGPRSCCCTPREHQRRGCEFSGVVRHITYAPICRARHVRDHRGSDSSIVSRVAWRNSTNAPAPPAHLVGQNLRRNCRRLPQARNQSAAGMSDRSACAVSAAPEIGAGPTAFITEPSPENHDRLWQRAP